MRSLLNRAQLCMAMLLDLRTHERNMVERYLEGMAFIGKTDVQMVIAQYDLSPAELSASRSDRRRSAV